MSQFKSALEQLHDRAKDLEDGARGLENQNLADIIGAARKRIAQAIEHPDADVVGKAHQDAPLPFFGGSNQANPEPNPSYQPPGSGA
jgi:hypothetical protein